MFYITYRIDRHPEGITKDEVLEMRKKEDVGACDNIVIASIIGTPGTNEELSAVFASVAKDGGKLTDDQMWTIWAVWAACLAKSETLDSGKRDLCQIVVNAIRVALNIQNGVSLRMN